MYSCVKLIITHYTVIEPNKETVFEELSESEKDVKLDMCVYSNFVEGPIFRFTANKLPAHIKPENVMYFSFGDNIGLFDKLKLTFKGEGNDLNLKNVSVMVDLHEKNQNQEIFITLNRFIIINDLLTFTHNQIFK